MYNKMYNKIYSKIYSKMYMGQVLDCLYRLQHHHNRIAQLENNILEYEQFMEQLLINNNCCEIAPYNENQFS